MPRVRLYKKKKKKVPALLNGSYNIKAQLFDHKSSNFIGNQPPISQKNFFQTTRQKDQGKPSKAELTDISADTGLRAAGNLSSRNVCAESAASTLGKITRWHSGDLMPERRSKNIRTESDLGQESPHCLDEDFKAQSDLIKVAW